ncbi:MAG: 30S ribosomal protein S8 [Saprospiraceae bacterium]|nr:30S ribosomal protein S8 [Saprospiraceae bacterium]
MAVTDTIADFLTRIRNAQQAGHRIVDIPASKEKKTLTELLYKNGYILKYTFVDTDNKQGEIKIALKYDPVSRIPAIRELVRVSRPGRRIYKGAESLPKIINGLGVAFISTSKGIMSDKEARAAHVGGEVMCYVL